MEIELGSQATNMTRSDEAATGTIHGHFSRIAPKYHDLRITDLDPVRFIAKEIRKLVHIEAADVGCGPGRYSLLLCKHLGNKLNLACIDANTHMLRELDAYMKRHGISNFTPMNSAAEDLPFPNNTLDCIFAFNAVHHFSLPSFLQECARVLKNGSYLFVYTRLREQNRRNIWGRYFPKFHQKETRLYTLKAFTQAVAEFPALRLKWIEYFTYTRTSTIEWLTEQAKAHHYSTFCLYPLKELEDAITAFQQNIKSHFMDVHEVKWLDENALFVISKSC
jgi:ubiquinone/menaquinone biosynthesis C-methylase UbiE